MIYHDQIPLNEALKLIRLNVFYRKFFYLKYVEKNKLYDLIDIINVCGGEIIEPDESIDFAIKKIFVVCSFNVYEKERNIILNESKKNSNFILVSEKFVLDCFYFMCDLSDESENYEYNPEIYYKNMKLFFK